MAGCLFCKAPPPDLDHGVKAYSQCDLLEGGPCHPCREYIDLTSRIQDAKMALEDMVAQEREMRTRINQFHDPITRRFPTEIISLVFQHALPDKWTSFDELDEEIVDKALICGPLFLGSVCSAWRQIAWSSPPMWTIIRLVMKSRDSAYDRANVLRSWLARTGQLPLSIRIAFWPSPGYNSTERPDDIGLIHGLIDIVNRQSSRWNELEVQGPLWLFPKINEGVQSASNLHTLRATVTEDYDEETIVLDSPHFRPIQVALHIVCFKIFRIDWSHVTHISVTRCFSDECVELLRSVTGLLECDLLEVHEDHETPSSFDAQPITRSNLETLCIIPVRRQRRTLQTCPQRTILNSFIFPSLRDAEIMGSDSDSLLKLITRSSCTLVSLIITTEGFEGNLSLQSFLSMVPTLEELGVESHGDLSTTETVYPFFNQISATSAPNLSLDQSVSAGDSDGNQTIVPKLKVLRLYDFSRTVEFWQHLSQIFGLVSDMHHPHRRPLNKLVVKRNPKFKLGEEDYIEKEVVLKFLELRNAGITLIFTDDCKKDDLLDLSIARHSLKDHGIISKFN